jgi:tripartite-type tricarboxylate transporter receptor subunit TctC
MPVGILVITVAILAMGCGVKGQAENPANFYKGKTIEIIVCSSPGATSDLVARVIAPYLSRDTGATVLVSNRAGAGGIEGTNYLYNSNPDGLTLGMAFSTKFVSSKVLDDPAAMYEIDKFSYIMSIGRAFSCFFTSPEGPYQSIADLRAARGLKIGGAATSGYITLGGLTVIKVLGLDAKVITGFQGESERSLAVKRGDTVGHVSQITGVQSYIDAGMLKPMFMLATERDPIAPDVPAITELVNLSGEDLRLINLWESGLASFNLFFGPPGIPEDKLAFLHNLVNKWIQDEKFREEINAVCGSEVKSYNTGDNIHQAMLDMAAALEKYKVTFSELIAKFLV